MEALSELRAETDTEAKRIARLQDQPGERTEIQRVAGVFFVEEVAPKHERFKVLACVADTSIEQGIGALCRGIRLVEVEPAHAGDLRPGS